MKLKTLIKKEVGSNKYPQLTRIRIGKWISFVAALPLFTSWMFLFSIPMMIPLSPTVWAKSKLIDFKQWRKL